MNDLEIMDRQATLIEEQKQLFLNIVDEFKGDLTYMQGLMTMMAIEHKQTKYISEDAITFIRDHLSEMQSILNDFDMRMRNYERD
jgi:ferritin-like protein